MRNDDACPSETGIKRRRGVLGGQGGYHIDGQIIGVLLTVGIDQKELVATGLQWANCLCTRGCNRLLVKCHLNCTTGNPAESGHSAARSVVLSAVKVALAPPGKVVGVRVMPGRTVAEGVLVTEIVPGTRSICPT